MVTGLLNFGGNGLGGFNAGTFNGSNVAALGDSITANNSSNSATLKIFSNIGYLTWFRILSKQAFNFDITNNYGNSGDTIQQVSARTSSVIASGCKVCFVLAGTNNLITSDTFTTMKNAMLTGILRPLLAAGIQPIVITITPRGSITTAQNQKRSQFNQWLRELAFGRPDALTAAGFPAGKNILLSDPSAAMSNYSDGTPIASMFSDAVLHPNCSGAYVMGKQLMADVGWLFMRQQTQMNEFFDVYDATNNPSGNLILSGTTNFGLLAGTGGTLTTNAGLAPTGQVATGWQIYRALGGSTATFVGSKENPRSDTINGNGERQVLTVNCAAVSGTGFEYYRLQNLNNILNVSAGDRVYAECTYQVAPGMTNLNAIVIGLVEAGPASPQSALDGNGGSVAGSLTEAHYGTLRTPVITLQTGVTNLSCQIAAIVSTAGATAANVQVAFGDPQSRKAQVY